MIEVDRLLKAEWKSYTKERTWWVNLNLKLTSKHSGFQSPLAAKGPWSATNENVYYTALGLYFNG